MLLDGRLHWFVAHLVARRPRWSGRFAVAMNAEWLGDLDLGPRAHPGDGLLDLTEGSLGLRDRLAARRRARTGSHLPHPGLRTSRSASAELSFPDGVPVYLDGVAVGTAAGAAPPRGARRAHRGRLRRAPAGPARTGR